MITAIKHTILVILLCLPSFAQSQVPQQGGPSMAAGNTYVLFIHAGPKKSDDPEVRNLALKLAQARYLVREPDNDQDVVSGPGVDYFSDQAKETAQDVAKIVNDFLGPLGQSETKKLKPRLQSVKNPPTYLGIWLY